MILDIKPLLRGEVHRIPVEYSFTPDPITGVRFEGEAQVCGEVTDNAGYMRLNVRVSVAFTAGCARCLDDVRGDFSEDFERTVVPRGSVQEETLEENVDEYAVLDENGMLDVDDEIRETMALSFPSKILCDEDCPGLCPKCGRPLKEGPCSCPTKEIDPRLAILQKLLDNPEK